MRELDAVIIALFPTHWRNEQEFTMLKIMLEKKKAANRKTWLGF